MFGTPAQALRVMVHTRSKGYSAAKLNHACADTTTHLASPTYLKNWEQCCIDIQLTALFKITWGLLSVNSNGPLYPVTHRSCRLHSKSFIPFKLACPLSIYPFPEEQWSNLPASVFSEHCSLDTSAYHVNHFFDLCNDVIPLESRPLNFRVLLHAYRLLLRRYF